MLSDAEIVRQWTLAKQLMASRVAYRPPLLAASTGPRMGERLAMRIVDGLEAQGVTEADIDRLGLA